MHAYHDLALFSHIHVYMMPLCHIPNTLAAYCLLPAFPVGRSRSPLTDDGRTAPSFAPILSRLPPSLRPMMQYKGSTSLAACLPARLPAPMPFSSARGQVGRQTAAAAPSERASERLVCQGRRWREDRAEKKRPGYKIYLSTV